MPPTNREMTGWTFSLTMRNTSTAMEMMIAKTNCVMIVVPPKLLTWPLGMPAAVRHGRSDSCPGNGVEIPRHSRTDGWRAHIARHTSAGGSKSRVATGSSSHTTARTCYTSLPFLTFSLLFGASRLVGILVGIDIYQFSFYHNI